MDQDTIIDEIIRQVINTPSVSTKRELQKIMNSVLRNRKISTPPPLFHLLDRYREMIEKRQILEDSRIIKLFRKRAVRSLSGVSVISLLTKSWGCPGTCVFCPTFDQLPKSYVPSEPAVMRAELNSFDPVKQVQNRLRSLESTGHAIAKCDVRVIGGTWSFYPQEYQESVMIGIYDGHSTYSELRKHLLGREMWDRLSGFKIRKWYENVASSTLEEAQKRNESSPSRVIWIAIETRPDWIHLEEIRHLRVYGVTRVEIGYQTTIDAINILNKRWHGNQESIEATRLLKDAWFKVVAHMMPNLLWATPDIDRDSMQEVFKNPDFRPDELKIYPMVVTEHSELYEIWKSGGFTPYDDETLIGLMSDLESMLPEYVRLNRSYRDIPADQIIAGSKNSNLRELTAKRMETLGKKRHDISAREIRSKWNNPEDAVLERSDYEASGGKEIFLQFIDPTDRTLFWLLRLRIPSQHYTKEVTAFKALQSAAIIRELHVFGDQLPVGVPWNGTGQHMWFGKRLLQTAEDIIRNEYPDLQRIAVISGVGVRGYYRKFWYIDEETYMIKILK